MTGTPRRSIAARIGVTLLNLIAPGLGLLRVAGLRAAAGYLAAPTLLLLALAGFGWIAPTPGFAAFATVVLATMAALIALMIVAMVRTWRASRQRAPVKGWSRWYGIVAASIVAGVAANAAAEACHALYKPYYIPSEAMLPTLADKETFLTDMRGGRHPARGDIVLFDMPELHTVYIKRVVALPGDRVALVGGVPVINGRKARQVPVGGRTYRETLPGEAGSHAVLDLGPSDLDDMAERVVPPGQLFVLGDNRDRSADSRVPRSEFGTGWVPVRDVVGVPLFTYWNTDLSRIGRKLTP
ncbi:signal peptidase I [Sphingomonas immobilis]|uniref:Signal peptidase I n=1 Tax=Sphingomonas immobilis TaxID=3063997 RepID=A0ABT9A2P3_9SPHN|nr:signal peptidase I [Sphingomonas sp. CA1-15]MDO7843261.1 signal peptidase I [Sphingomonas sp. CA1-15]